MSSPLARLRRVYRRYGAAGTVRRAAALARERVSSRTVYVWYELVLREERPRRPLDDAFRLVRAGPEHLPLLEELWAIDPAEARRRLAGEGTLWLVLDGERPVFSCWIFHGRTPFRAARGRWLPLPEDSAGLEESLTSPHYRGRGVAPAAWSAIADALEEAEPGLRRIVTTIEEENTASRRAVEKIGFREVGEAETVRRGGRERVRVAPRPAADAEFLRPLERTG